MPRGISNEEVADKIIRGIVKAQNKYKKWSSNELWLGYAPEYLMTCCIAESLASDKNCFVELETPVGNIIKKLDVKKNKPMERKNGRVDISLYYQSSKLKSVIEVKSPVYCYNTIKKDIKRLCSIKEIGHEIGHNVTNYMACFMWSEGNGEKLESKMEAKCNRIKDKIVEDTGIKIINPIVKIKTEENAGLNDNNAACWAAVVFVI